MSFGVGGSDVILGLKVAWQIYQYGFAEENRADVRYKNFQNDIFNFRYLLERLNEALQNAQRRYQNRGPILGIQPHEPLGDDFEAERKTIIGNFLATLKECETLLAENKQFRRRCSTVWENLHYNLSQQEPRVDLLRRRLHFHSEKIRLVLDRLSIKLLTDIDAKVDDILAVSQQNLQVSQEIQLELQRLHVSLLGYASGQSLSDTTIIEDNHVVSAGIAQKFEACLLLDAPPGTESGIPLPQGFDALLMHFQQSNEGTDQTPEKYLLFLKARWLLARMKQSREYYLARPGFYYKRAINQIGQAISAKTRQPGDLIVFEESVLLDLAESHFQIWPSSASARAVEYSQPHPLMVRANEERVASIELACNDDDKTDFVTVFKSSNEQLRIVLQTASSLTPGDKVIIPQVVVVREDKLIPRYALPTLINPCLEMAVFSRNEEMLYKFRNFADLSKFQTALMGYDISHDQSSVRCQFNKDASLLNGPEGQPTEGRLQLWQEPVTRSSFSTAIKTAPVAAEATLSGRAHSRHDSLSPSLTAASTINATVGGWEADRIRLPSLVVFTQLPDHRKGARFAIISIELEPGMYIDPHLCKCHSSYDTCANLVLKSEVKRSFPVRILCSDVDTNGCPNSNTFDIFPLRLPHTADFKQIERKQTEFLLLNFKRDGLAGKRRFHRELQLRFMVRDKQIKDQRDFENMIRLRQDRPQRRQTSLSSATGDGRIEARSPSTSESIARQDSTYEGSVSCVSSASKDPAISSPVAEMSGPLTEAYSDSGDLRSDREDGGSSRTDSTIRHGAMRRNTPATNMTSNAIALHDQNCRVGFDNTTVGEDHLTPQAEFQVAKTPMKPTRKRWYKRL